MNIDELKGMLMGQRGNEAGFTLVELLIVVSILGILATIAIPAYLDQRRKGYNSAALSDLKNSKAALEAAFTEDGSYPVP